MPQSLQLSQEFESLPALRRSCQQRNDEDASRCRATISNFTLSEEIGKWIVLVYDDEYDDWYSPNSIEGEVPLLNSFEDAKETIANLRKNREVNETAELKAFKIIASEEF